VWWCGVVLLAATCAAWALAMPAMSGPDEAAHAVRAAAVVRGQLIGAKTPPAGNNPEWANVFVDVRVPSALAAAAAVGDCHRVFGVSNHPAHISCPRPPRTHHITTARTYEHRGQPLFYLLLGVPTLFTTSAAGLLAMRALNVALCSAFLASGLASLMRLPNRPLVALGALVALSPEVLYLAGTANSSGFEIAAAFSLWASGLALLDAAPQPDRRLVNRFGLALSALLVARGFSPIFTVLIVASLVATAPRQARTLLGLRQLRLWLGVAAAAMAASVVWLAHMELTLPLHGYPPIGFGPAVRRLPQWTSELVAVFGSSDVTPPLVAVLWGAAGVVVVGLAVIVARTDRRHLAVAAAVFASAFGLMLTSEAVGIPQIGFAWQGRYVLALVVGALLVASSGHADRLARKAGPPTIALLVAAHVGAFAYALRHYTVSDTGPRNPIRYLLHPVWTPPLPPVVLLAWFSVAVVLLSAWLWQVSSAVRPGR